MQAIELIKIEFPKYTKSQAHEVMKNCTAKCRGGINVTTGEKTNFHPSVQKITNARYNPINNPKNNAKKQVQVAAENHLILMEMFKNGKIKEKPLNEEEIEEIVDGLFLAQGILNDENIAIYTGYTGCGLKEEPYRYYIYNIYFFLIIILNKYI